MPETRLWWARPLPALEAHKAARGQTGWFLALHLTAQDVAAIRFGDEGHSPALLPIDQFLSAPDAIAPLQARLRLVLG